jgi:hypothetical protein
VVEGKYEILHRFYQAELKIFISSLLCKRLLIIVIITKSQRIWLTRARARKLIRPGARTDVSFKRPDNGRFSQLIG